MFLEHTPYKEILNKLSNERKIIYLTYGGSHAYGTNMPISDIDVRGIALKTKKELLGRSNFEQFLNEETDTTIYSVDKFIDLALGTNPNIIEMLGTKEEHKFLVSPEMQFLIDNKKIFLSRLAINSFGGYATAQLRRLENALQKNYNQSNKEVHLYNTIMNMQEHLRNHYRSYDNSNFKLYIDETDRQDFKTEMFVDIDLKHYPLRDFHWIQSEMNQAINSYDKLNHRNSKKTEQKLDKHVMHLVRLYLMLFDILEKEEINTYREKDVPMLMDIRNGKWSENNYEKLYDKLSEFELRLQYAKENTNLPNKPNYKKAEELLIEINLNSIKE